jgi:hypothetical protein
LAIARQLVSNLPRTKLPERNPWEEGLASIFEEAPEQSKDVSPRDLEFPMTSACLHEGLKLGSDDPHLKSQPLGTVFQDDNLEYGMVIVDISNFTTTGPSLGVVAFRTDHIALVPINGWTGQWDPVEDDPPLKEPVPTLQQHRPRIPFSLADYMSRFYRDYYSPPEEREELQVLLTELNHLPHLDPLAIECKLIFGDTQS